MAVVVKPSKSLLNIRSGIKSIKDSFSGLKKNAGNLNDVMLKKTKVKRESIARNYILSQRRQEEERRKNKEDLLEASTIGGVVKRQAKAVASSAKGFLGRIMDFLATLLVGWLLTNLPSIITMAQELIARIQRLYTIVTGFFNNTVKLFRGFGNLLSAVGKNILTFDFTDSKRRVESSLKDLGGTFEDMQSQFDEGFKLLTTSLGEGVVSGENTAPFGTQYENESMQQQPAPSGGGFSGSGVAKGAQIAKRLQKDLGLKDYQAAAVVGNLLQENTNLVPDLLEGSKKGLLPEAMRKGIGYGWAQWTYPSRQQELFNLAKSMGVDPTKQPLTDEINYAMLVRELPRYDSGGRFRNSKNIEEASNWILFQYENPADKGSREQQERIEDSRKILKGIGAQPTPTPSSTPRPTQPSQAVSTSVVDEFKGKPGGAAGIITSERKMRLSPTSGKYRMHHGIDIAPAGRGYYVALKLSGKVNLVAFDSEGYGNYVDIKSGNTIYRFAHLAKVYVKQGQTYNGATIGEIGSTGGSTGIHLHFEVRPGGGDSINPRPYLGLLSIGRQLTGLAGQPVQVATPRPTPAQITPSGTQQRRQASQQLAQQQVGPSIIIIEEEPPAPQPQGYIDGGGAMMIPLIINPLNSFITKKLLLDLAYT